MAAIDLGWAAPVTALPAPAPLRPRGAARRTSCPSRSQIAAETQHRVRGLPIPAPHGHGRHVDLTRRPLTSLSAFFDLTPDDSRIKHFDLTPDAPRIEYFALGLTEVTSVLAAAAQSVAKPFRGGVPVTRRLTSAEDRWIDEELDAQERAAAARDARRTAQALGRLLIAAVITVLATTAGAALAVVLIETGHLL